jgi:hypothetical protein
MIELENYELSLNVDFFVECGMALSDQVGLVTQRKF